MDTQQQRNLLGEIGGEPLDGSGFETENPLFEEQIEPEAEEQEDQQ
jgi:hypothetical protein